jgi:deoxycytidine triphosphate deaminase
MSVLGVTEVLRRIKEQELIVGLSPRELENPEGVGLDLRLLGVHVITEGGAFIEADGEEGLGLRRGVQTQPLAEWKEGGNNEFVLIEPGRYYLVKTMERVNTPMDLMPIIYPRTSLLKAGLQLLASKTDPGYCGPLVFGLKNLSDFSVKLQLGARFCNIVFFTIEGVGTAYRGQHQGGRVSIKDTERQV